MATSSIFASFDLRDKETAEAFLDALEASEADPVWEPITPVKPPMTDYDAIRELWGKRKKDK